MNKLEEKTRRLVEIQNRLDTTRDVDEFMRLSQEAQRIIDWLDSMPHNIRV